MMRIYGSLSPMYLKAVMVAEELGLKYEVVPVDISKGEARTPEHMARHPFGKVPVLEHEGRHIFESNAIIRYMAGVAKSPLYPDDLYQRAVVDQWVDYFTLQVGRWTTSCWFETCIAPKYFNRQPNEQTLRDAKEALLEAMPVVNAHLAKNPHLAGSQLTLADINAYALTQGWRDAGLNFTDFPEFLRWFDGVAARDGIKRAWTLLNP